MGTKTEKINITPDKSLFPKLGQTGYTVAEALSELIDNSIDARNKDVEINITIDKKKGLIVVEDNGLGMSKDVASRSIVLGDSIKKEGKLGKFGIGLKTSCMSLGKKFTLETSPVGTDEEYILVFDEEEFLSTGSWHEFDIKIKEGVDKKKSFTRISIEKLRINFYGNFFEVLKKHLSERFSPFISNGEVVIKLNKEKIKAEKFEIFPDSKNEFTISLSNGSEIKGWTGILKVGSVERSGFNLYRFNRLIRAHEKVGYIYHPSKMAITGEVHMNPIPVTHNKREFITEDPLYVEFFKKFSEYLKPILAEVQKRHQEEKIKDLPREIKETLKDNLLKALNNTDELKELAFPGSELKKRSKDDGMEAEKEEREKPENEVGTVEKEPQAEKDRNPKKTSENKARFITIAGHRYRFDYEWGSLDETMAKQAYLDKEKNTIMVILNSHFNLLKVLPKADIFYHIVFLTEGIVEVFLKENHLSSEKVIGLRDKLTQQLADVMSEDIDEVINKKDSQMIEAQSYLLQKSDSNDYQLSDNEKVVLEKRMEEGLTFQQIANELHLSRQRIDQLFRSALNKISGIYPRKAEGKLNEDIAGKVVKVDKEAIDAVIESTANMYGVTTDDILSNGRRADLILPRHTIMYVLRKDLGLSFPKIAQIMKKKDHTTVMHAYTKMNKLMSSVEVK